MRRILALILTIVLCLTCTACDWESGWEQPDWPSEYEDSNATEEPAPEDVTVPSEDEKEPTGNVEIEGNVDKCNLFFEMERQLYAAQNINLNIKFVDTAEDWDCSLVWDKISDEYALEIKDSVSGEFENTYITNDDGFRYYQYSKYEHVTDVGYTNEIERFVTMFNNIIDMEPFYTVDNEIHNVNGKQCYQVHIDEEMNIKYYEFDFILYIDADTLQLVRVENTEEENEQRYIVDIDIDNGAQVVVPQETLKGASNAYEELRDDVQEAPGYRDYFGQSADALNVTMGDDHIWIGMEAKELFELYTNKAFTSVTSIEAPFKTKGRMNAEEIPENGCVLYTISTKSGENSQILVAIKNPTSEPINKKDGIVCGIYYIMDTFLPCDTKNVTLNADIDFEEIKFGQIKNIMASNYSIEDPITTPSRGFDCVWVDGFVEVRLNINDERNVGYLFIQDSFCAEYFENIRQDNN